MKTVEVVHNPDQQRFVLAWQGQQAILDYHLFPATTTAAASVDFHHTYLPPELRGQGLAEPLVQFGLRWAAQQNLQIVASCWYVAKIISADTKTAAAHLFHHDQG